MNEGEWRQGNEMHVMSNDSSIGTENKSEGICAFTYIQLRTGFSSDWGTELGGRIKLHGWV